MLVNKNGMINKILFLISECLSSSSGTLRDLSVCLYLNRASPYLVHGKAEGSGCCTWEGRKGMHRGTKAQQMRMCAQSQWDRQSRQWWQDEWMQEDSKQ